MQRLKIIFTVLYILIVSGDLIIAQDSTEIILFKAMKDEIERNISNLEYKDYAKPFYISYAIEDVKTIYASASLGALNTSAERKYRSWSNRVLCGSYELNDENFLDATRRKPPSDGLLRLPLDDDYYGIRRALWMVTNNTYKSAAENYKSKLASLKDKNLTKNDLEMPDFGMASKVDTHFNRKLVIWNKNWLESKVKHVSEVMLQYPDVIYSDVIAYQIHADIYFYSTEKTKIKLPLDYIFFTITAYYEANDGENISGQLRYLGIDPANLPNDDSIISETHLLAKSLIDRGNAPRLNENYNGPVLFLGQAAAEILLQGLFGNNDNLLAYREPLYNNSQMSMYYGQNVNSLESKLNKPVISKNISIVDYSTLQQYNGQEAFGCFKADAEGVLPVDSLTLIENGILKNLYSSRTPTRSSKISNGHLRYMIQDGSISSNIGPGVLKISSSECFSEQDMKSMLIKQAREEGLDYAIIVKPLLMNKFYCPFMMYKVGVTDGKETLVRGVTLKPISINGLKKIIAASQQSSFYNTMINESGFDVDGSMDSEKNAIPSGSPVSIIYPNALIINEVEIEFITKALVNDKPVVDSPLKGIGK
jgi:hypothetical protein